MKSKSCLLVLASMSIGLLAGCQNGGDDPAQSTGLSTSAFTGTGLTNRTELSGDDELSEEEMFDMLGEAGINMDDYKGTFTLHEIFDNPEDGYEESFSGFDAATYKGYSIDKDEDGKITSIFKMCELQNERLLGMAYEKNGDEEKYITTSLDYSKSILTAEVESPVNGMSYETLSYIKENPDAASLVYEMMFAEMGDFKYKEGRADYVFTALDDGRYGFEFQMVTKLVDESTGLGFPSITIDMGYKLEFDEDYIYSLDADQIMQMKVGPKETDVMEQKMLRKTEFEPVFDNEMYDSIAVDKTVIESQKGKSYYANNVIAYYKGQRLAWLNITPGDPLTTAKLNADVATREENIVIDGYYYDKEFTNKFTDLTASFNFQNTLYIDGHAKDGFIEVDYTYIDKHVDTYVSSLPEETKDLLDSLFNMQDVKYDVWDQYEIISSSTASNYKINTIRTAGIHCPDVKLDGEEILDTLVNINDGNSHEVEAMRTIYDFRYGREEDEARKVLWDGIWYKDGGVVNEDISGLAETKSIYLVLDHGHGEDQFNWGKEFHVYNTGTERQTLEHYATSTTGLKLGTDFTMSAWYYDGKTKVDLEVDDVDVSGVPVEFEGEIFLKITALKAFEAYTYLQLL